MAKLSFRLRVQKAIVKLAKHDPSKLKGHVKSDVDKYARRVMYSQEKISEATRKAITRVTKPDFKKKKLSLAEKKALYILRLPHRKNGAGGSKKKKSSKKAKKSLSVSEMKVKLSKKYPNHDALKIHRMAVKRVHKRNAKI